jgi:coenzyme F420 biosynthesis associated uncharacterized protein
LTGLVDWGLAARILDAGIGDGPAGMSSSPDLDSIHAKAQRAVLGYTGLRPAEPLPEAEWVTRREWAELNLSSMRELIAPLEHRVTDSLDGAAGGALRAVAGRIVALEIGGLLVLASKRVLGQYEFPLLGGERAPRLVFVGQNIDAAATELGGSPPEVLEWVALHEVTHAVHFGSAPWLRNHLGGLARRLMESDAPDLSAADVIAWARRLGTGDPRGRLAEVRAGGPLTLLAPASSRATIAETQATMAAVEGYAEHVMDAAAGSLAPTVARLRVAIERRRESGGTLARLLSWLLGLEMKLRQYREGKRFADSVVEAAGIEGLNRAWNGPDCLPDESDLADPQRWLARVTARPLAA